MKLFSKLLVLAILMTSSSVFAAGYIATYSVKVSDSAKFVNEMDALMASDWGKSFPADVSIISYAFNGYDDATHGVVMNYESDEDMANGTSSFYQPVFAEFLQKISSVSEAVEQSLNVKLISGGDSDPAKNQVYMIYRMKVKDPAGYAKAYSKIVKAAEEAGNMEGAYGLRAQMAGNNNYYSHYAFNGASSMESLITSTLELQGSDDFKEFSEAVTGNREIIQTSIGVVIKIYPK